MYFYTMAIASGTLIGGGIFASRHMRTRAANVSTARMHEILVHTYNLVDISWGDTWHNCLFSHIARVVGVDTGERTRRDPVCNAVAKALGFPNVDEGIRWNDQSGRQKAQVLTRLERAIRDTAPLPRDPLVGAQHQLVTNDPPSIEPSEAERMYVGV